MPEIGGTLAASIQSARPLQRIEIFIRLRGREAIAPAQRGGRPRRLRHNALRLKRPGVGECLALKLRELADARFGELDKLGKLSVGKSGLLAGPL